MLQLDALALFCDLVETGSFSRAAERNFISQSAVSQRIRALEAQFGQRLLERGQGRGIVRPTEAGAILAEGAKRLLREAAQLEASLHGLSDEVSGTVRVATVYSVGLHALPPRLKPFLASHPKVNIHLEYKQTAQIYQEVTAGSMDVGIVACPAARRGVEVIPFDEEPMRLLCAPEHRLAARDTVPMNELDGEAFIGFSDDIPTRSLVDERLRAAGVRVRLIAAYDNIETIKNLVEIGSGMSIVPEETVRQEVRSGTLVARPFATGEGFMRPTGLLVKTTANRRAAVRAFVDAMRQPSVSGTV